MYDNVKDPQLNKLVQETLKVIADGPSMPTLFTWTQSPANRQLLSIPDLASMAVLSSWTVCRMVTSDDPDYNAKLHNALDVADKLWRLDPDRKEWRQKSWLTSYGVFCYIILTAWNPKLLVPKEMLH